MKYSLRSLMTVVLVLPPLLAWGALPLYRWLTAPTVIKAIWVSDHMPQEVEQILRVTLSDSQTPAAKPPKP